MRHDQKPRAFDRQGKFFKNIQAALLPEADIQERQIPRNVGFQGGSCLAYTLGLPKVHLAEVLFDFIPKASAYDRVVIYQKYFRHLLIPLY
jgi:hypothetical protein